MENNENMVTSSNAATNGNMAQNDHVEKSKATMPAVNRTFKSTVFIMLFEDKKNLLELYNAVENIIQTRNFWKSIHWKMPFTCRSRMMFRF